MAPTWQMGWRSLIGILSVAKLLSGFMCCHCTGERFWDTACCQLKKRGSSQTGVKLQLTVYPQLDKSRQDVNPRTEPARNHRSGFPSHQSLCLYIHLPPNWLSQTQEDALVRRSKKYLPALPMLNLLRDFSKHFLPINPIFHG